MAFLHDAQYLGTVVSSQSQNGASTKSESSGDGKRPNRGVGGGVGSAHLGNVERSTFDFGFTGFGEAGMTTTFLGYLGDCCLTYTSRDDAKPTHLDGVCEAGYLGGSRDDRQSSASIMSFRLMGRD